MRVLRRLHPTLKSIQSSRLSERGFIIPTLEVSILEALAACGGSCLAFEGCSRRVESSRPAV